jgi:hypothetical protein
MAKFDFNNSRYVKMFEDSLEGKNIINYILSDPNLLRANYDAWKNWFRVDSNVTPTAADGTASFTVSAREPEHSDLMDWRAPLGDSRVAREGQSVKYSGTIIDFISKGWQEKAMEREYKEKLFNEFGSDAPLLLGYAENVLQPRLDSANQTLTAMSAQVMTNGFVKYMHGQGITGNVYKAAIPEKNFAKALSKIWTDPECQLLDEMVELERIYREDVWGLPNIGLQWWIDRDTMVNVFLKNKQVIDTIKTNWLLSKGQLISQTDSVAASVVSIESFNTYVIGKIEGLSPIHVISEKQSNDGTIVSSWKKGTAVLCPTGYSGIVLHTDILDEVLYTKYGNSLQTRAFGKTMDGLVTVMNYMLPDGNMKLWGTDFFMSAVPVLDDFLYHVIVDYTQVKD